MMQLVNFKNKKLFKETYELLDTVVLSAVLVIIAFTFLFRIFIVSGPSMNDTLSDGERIVVSNLAYKPEYGDIICFYADSRNEVLVKRVIATEGQTVDIGIDNAVYVDGNKLDEPYIKGKPTEIPDYLPFSFPYTVEKDKIIVMGDNRTNSTDSRYSEIGAVDIDMVLGKLLLRVSPDFGKVE